MLKLSIFKVVFFLQNVNRHHWQISLHIKKAASKEEVDIGYY